MSSLSDSASVGLAQGQHAFSLDETNELISLFASAEAWSVASTADDPIALEGTCYLRDVREACAEVMQAAMNQSSRREAPISNEMESASVEMEALPFFPNRISKTSRAGSALRRDLMVNNFRATSTVSQGDRKKRRNIGRLKKFASDVSSQSQFNYSTSTFKSIESAFVENIGASHLATWQMLYCGGSQAVVNVLNAIHNQYGVKLRIEKFDW